MELHRRPRLVLDLLAVLICALALSGCVLRGGRGGGGGGGGDDDDSVPTNETSGQVRFEGLEAYLLDWGVCAPGGVEMACGHFEIVFEIVHSGDDELVELDRLEVTAGDMEFVTNEPCDEWPWIVQPSAALASSITIEYDGEEGFPTMYHRCGNSTVLFTDPVPGDAPKGGTLTVEALITGVDFVHRVTGSAEIQFGGPMR